MRCFKEKGRRLKREWKALKERWKIKERVEDFEVKV